jgi:acid phosphatase type 7
VDFKGLTFLALDSNRVTEEEINWLKSLPIGKRYIPFFHHPAYPVLLGHQGSNEVIRKFIPQFKRLGVRLVFTGHNHGYDRNEVDGITYMTSGGGGAPLYPCGTVTDEKQVCVSEYHYVRCGISASAVTCQMKLTDGTILDSVSITL